MVSLPYAPPPEQPVPPPRKPVPLYLLIAMSMMVGLLTMLGMSSRPPTLLSPTPFLSIVLTKLAGLSVPMLSLLYGAAFTITQIRHFIGRPNEIIGVFSTLALSAMTIIAALYFFVDVPLGFVERGTTYTVLVASVNVLVGFVAWFFWFRARRPGNYFSQVYFGFTLHSWLAWYYLPYLGAA